MFSKEKDTENTLTGYGVSRWRHSTDYMAIFDYWNFKKIYFFFYNIHTVCSPKRKFLAPTLGIFPIFPYTLTDLFYEAKRSFKTSNSACVLFRHAFEDSVNTLQLSYLNFLHILLSFCKKMRWRTNWFFKETKCNEITMSANSTYTKLNLIKYVKLLKKWT